MKNFCLSIDHQLFSVSCLVSCLVRFLSIFHRRMSSEKADKTKTEADKKEVSLRDALSNKILECSTLPPVIISIIIDYLERDIGFIFDGDGRCWLLDPDNCRPSVSQNETKIQMEGLTHIGYGGKDGSNVHALELLRRVSHGCICTVYGQHTSSNSCRSDSCRSDARILMFDCQATCTCIFVIDPNKLIHAPNIAWVGTWQMPWNFHCYLKNGFRVSSDEANPHIVYVVGQTKSTMAQMWNEPDISVFDTFHLIKFDSVAQNWTYLTKLTREDHLTRTADDLLHLECDSKRQRIYIATTRFTFAYNLVTKEWRSPPFHQQTSTTDHHSTIKMDQPMEPFDDKKIIHSSANGSTIWRDRWFLNVYNPNGYSFWESHVVAYSLDKNKTPINRHLHQPNVRQHHSLCTLNDKLYFIVGTTTSEITNLTPSEQFAEASVRWITDKRQACADVDLCWNEIVLCQLTDEIKTVAIVRHFLDITEF